MHIFKKTSFFLCTLMLTAYKPHSMHAMDTPTSPITEASIKASIREVRNNIPPINRKDAGIDHVINQYPVMRSGFERTKTLTKKNIVTVLNGVMSLKLKDDDSGMTPDDNFKVILQFMVKHSLVPTWYFCSAYRDPSFHFNLEKGITYGEPCMMIKENRVIIPELAEDSPLFKVIFQTPTALNAIGLTDLDTTSNLSREVRERLYKEACLRQQKNAEIFCILYDRGYTYRRLGHGVVPIIYRELPIKNVAYYLINKPEDSTFTDLWGTYKKNEYKRMMAVWKDAQAVFNENLKKALKLDA